MTIAIDRMAPRGQQAAPGPEETVHRLAEYFMTLGLAEAEAAEAARGIVAIQQGDWRAESSGLAMDEAITRVADWLDEIAAAVGHPSIDLRSQCAWTLRPALREDPRLFLARPDSAEELRSAVILAARPMLPAPSPTAMRAQPLGELPHFWHKMAAYAHLIGYKLRHLWEGT